LPVFGREEDAEYELAHSGYEMLPHDERDPMAKALTEYVQLHEMYAKGYSPKEKYDGDSFADKKAAMAVVTHGQRVRSSSPAIRR